MANQSTGTPVPAVPIGFSIEVAQYFQKSHEEVLSTIENLLSKLPPDFSSANFIETKYTDLGGDKHHAYQLTRKSLDLCAMAFTDPNSLFIELKHINNVFNHVSKQPDLNVSDPALLTMYSTKNKHEAAIVEYDDAIRKALPVGTRISAKLRRQTVNGKVWYYPSLGKIKLMEYGVSGETVLVGDHDIEIFNRPDINDAQNKNEGGAV